MDTLAEYIADCRAGNLSDGTVSLYERHIARLRTWLPAPHDLLQVSVQGLRAFFASVGDEPTRLGKRLSAHTLHQMHRALRTFYNWCVRQNLCETNPMLQVHCPRLPQRHKPRLSDDQLRALVTVAEQHGARESALVFVLIDCGLRVSELCGLNVEDVSLHARTLVVIGKGDKQRHVPFSPHTREKLSLLIGDQCAGPVFRNAQHGTRLTRSGVLKLFKRLGAAAGIPRLYPHLLRHTMARVYLRRGDLRSLQLILGHARISTTEIYTDLDLDDIRKRHEEASPFNDLAVRVRASQA